MNKKDIIRVISGVEAQIDKSIFNDDNTGIGCNQFRELADICNRAECYEEVELLIRYNEAKDRPKKDEDENGTNQNGNKYNEEKNDLSKYGSSWNCLMNDKKTTFAGIVISCMEKIKAQSDENNCLKNLSLFFGYFYWNARIWTAEKNNKKRGN